jgi:hypothetical protein
MLVAVGQQLDIQFLHGNSACSVSERAKYVAGLTGHMKQNPSLKVHRAPNLAVRESYR